MTGTQSPLDISTKLQRIAELARRDPRPLTALAHHIDIEFLREAYRRTRKDGAAGVDGETATSYAEKLDENLRSLLDRFKSGTYWRAPRGHHGPSGAAVHAWLSSVDAPTLARVALPHVICN